MRRTWRVTFPYHPLRALGADLRAMCEPNPARPAWVWVLVVTAKVLVVPKIRMVAYFRLAQWLLTKGALPLASLLTNRAIRFSAAEISPHAEIGPGLCIWHSAGVVIGSRAVIGERLTIAQNATVGGGLSRAGQPTIGDDVLIGAGATVLGPIKIGDGALIGAGALVTRDVAAGEVVYAAVRP